MPHFLSPIIVTTAQKEALAAWYYNGPADTAGHGLPRKPLAAHLATVADWKVYR